MSDIETLIQNVTDGNLGKAGDTFASIMNNKISDALDQEKISVASQMFNAEAEASDDNDDDIDLDDIDLDDIDLDDLDLED